MPGRRFIIFWIFLLFFFGIFFPGSSMNGILEWNFVFTFSAYVIPFWLKIMLGRDFKFFEFFYNFFRIFLARVEYERNSGVKFCSHFFGLSHPVLAKNNAGKRFYNLLNFFTIFFSECSCPVRVWTEFWSKILSSLFQPISSRFGYK